jgi:SAM-dependent methyltransferase
MTAAGANADQIAYWNGVAGEKWTTAKERLDAMLSPVSARILDELAPASRERVLDIGCGCGETTIALERAGTRPTGIDISRPMLDRARSRAPDTEFLLADAATHPFSPDFDALFSRFGVMFFDDPDAAFVNLRTALKPGGRLVFACWRDWRENEWVSLPVSAVRHLLPPQPQLGPEAPGPFAFADLARVRRILSGAGFDRITATPFDAALSMGESLPDAIRHLAEIGPVSRMLSDATPAERTSALASLEERLRPLANRAPVTLGGAVWIISARV